MEYNFYYEGNDGFGRPVYKCDGRLYVDVDPRLHRGPELCTKANNEFDGEPDTPIVYTSKFQGATIIFHPSRVTW